LEFASAETASQIIAEALSISVVQSLDAQVFSTNAATTSAPAGLLNGIAALTSGGTTGAAGVATDLAKLTGAIAAQGVNPDDAVFVCSAATATKIKVLASPKLTNDIFSAFDIPDNQIICVVPDAVWVAFPNSNVQVEINLNSAALAQFEDTSPAADPLTAGPTKSLWQQALVGIKIRADCAWAINAGGIAWLTGIAW
jgi:hypothetical protein